MPRKGKTSQRGYGAAHRRVRRTWEPRVRTGLVDCWRCGHRIHRGQLWHLGHDDHDRTKYRGPEHEHCNVQAGSAKAHQRDPEPRPYSRWEDRPMAHTYDGPATLLIGGRELAVHAVLKTEGATYLRSWGGSLANVDSDDPAELFEAAATLGEAVLRLPDDRTGDVHIGGKVISSSGTFIEVCGRGTAPYTTDDATLEWRSGE